MIHLGICYGHNATVAVVRDGELVFCQSEERLNRIKNSTGFPSVTLDHVYRTICPPEAVASATLFQRSNYGYLALKAHGFKPYQYGDFLDPALKTRGLRQWVGKTAFGWKLREQRIARRERDGALRDEALAYYAKELRLSPDRIRFLDHHGSHAHSAIANVLPWQRALVLTLDGVGDWTCATVNLLEDGRLRCLARTDHRHSLGYYYSATTALLGMKAGEHEFKVMGLAPYAKEDYFKPILAELESLITVTDDGEWVSAVTPSQLEEALERVYRHRRFDNVAGAIQAHTERLVLKWVKAWIRKTGCGSVAVAGGVFMNVKACQKLAAQPEVERLFVVPSAADESTAIGCAYWSSRELEPERPLVPLRDLYLGMAYDDDAIRRAIEESGAAERYHISMPSDVNDEVGRLLSENEVVARCSGRMEFGARALGNRSILANPSRFENLNFINDAIKSRDFWMPFTPSILEEDMPRYVDGHERVFAPYMCITFDSTAEARRDLIAAIHPRDHTLRPQCVMRAWNPDYHAIISAFKARTGIGGVLNTSFNLHGEPNVCSPRDAIRTVDLSGLRHLAMGRYLLSKRA